MTQRRLVDQDQDNHLAEVLSEFARTLVTDFPIRAILDHLVVRIVDVLPITSAGVTLISPHADPYYVASSNADALRYEKLQTELGEGPCVVAYETGEAVTVPDLRQEGRFPRFAERALTDGLMAAFTFPLRHGDGRFGALDLYRGTPGPLDRVATSAATTLADVASAYLINAQARADLEHSVERFRENALHDALTTLPNRVLFQQRLDHAALRARRSRKMAAVLFVDLDGFKRVNDTYGHRVGDELLVAVGLRLKGLLRPGDTLARLSGDEFVILCEDLDEAAQGEVVAARMNAAFVKSFVLSTVEIRTSASIGVAFSGPGDAIPEQLLREADAAMYQAKAKGGARHQIIDLRAWKLGLSRVDLEQDLEGAAGRGEMRTDYQPIVSTVDRRITGAEALLRWAHPSRGTVIPASLIPLAEHTGHITEIGRWVLDRACRDRHRLQQSSHFDLNMSVNVSARQLMGPEFCTSVESVLLETGTEPRLLTLELTETIVLEDVQRSLVVLDDLKELGVVLALDDFGTGYSSLSYLRQFPIDIVKIDREFIVDLGRDEASNAIVGAIVDLAHAFSMTVVAEGVETLAQYNEVVASGCEAAQGFLFARPISIDELDIELSRSWR